MLLMASPMLAVQPSELTSVEVRAITPIVCAQQINPTTVDLVFSNGKRMTFDFYGPNIFRMFQDNQGGIIRDPEAHPEAQILVNQPRKPISVLQIEDKDERISIFTDQIELQFAKEDGRMKVINRVTQHTVVEEVRPVSYEKNRTCLNLKEQPDEYF